MMTFESSIFSWFIVNKFHKIRHKYVAIFFLILYTKFGFGVPGSFILSILSSTFFAIHLVLFIFFLIYFTFNFFVNTYYIYFIFFFIELCLGVFIYFCENQIYFFSIIFIINAKILC